MKKILVMAALIMLLQTCSLDGYKSNLDSRFLNKSTTLSDENSIIITRAMTASNSFDKKTFDRNFNKMNWCRSDGAKKCQNLLYFNPYTKIKFRSDSRSDFEYDFYLVKSGYYFLDQMQQLRGYLEDWYSLPITIPVGILTFGNSLRRAPNFNTSLPGWNKKLNAPNYASFEVNAGEIVYIGDLIFTFTKQKYWFRGKANLVVEDNYEDAVRYFYEKHPEFKNRKVIKRLAKPGVMLDDFKGGFFW